MAELPTLPESADDPDGGGYKGRRAEQDSAEAAPMAPGPLGGLAQPTAAGPGGAGHSGQSGQLGPVAGQTPPVDSQVAWGQAAAAGQGPAGQPPWGGPVHDPVTGAGGPEWDGAGGHAAQAASAGLAPDGGPEYGLGAIYAPGSGFPGPVPGGYPRSPDQTGPVAPPDATTLAGMAGGATGFDRGGAAFGDPGLVPGSPATPVLTTPPAAPPPADPGGFAGPAAPAGPAGAGGPDRPGDGVSFHPGNLDALLSGHPGAPPSPAGLVGVGGAGGAAAGSGIAVSVDGAAVPVGGGGVRVEVGRDGTATVTADPVGAVGPVGRIAPAPAHGGQVGPGPAPPGQPTTAPDATQLLHGTGTDPATVTLTVDGSTLGTTPVQVVHNADGSLDLQVTGSNGHQVDVHVNHGRTVEVALSRDAHGDLVVRADPDRAGTTAGGPGTAPGGVDPAGRVDAVGAVGTDPPPEPDDPSGSSSAGPDAAAGGSAPPGGGLPGGGGGPPGGGAPTGPPAGPPSTGSGSTGSGTGTVKADPTAIKKLGTDLTNHAGPMLESAHRRTGDISVGFPAFGVLGLPLNMAHEQVKNTAQSYLASGRNQLDSWRTALNQTANNYRDAEDSSTVDGG